MTGESSVQTPGLHLPLRGGCSGKPAPKHNLLQQHGGLSFSPQPRAIVSAVIYVKAFVGLLVLTVPVLSNGNNYGSFHPYLRDRSWGERAPE